MLRSISLALFVVFSLMKGVSAEYCSYGKYSSYYCYPGQSCGTFYGDCRGLPTYVIIGIVSSCIVLLSICIRCCIQINSTNTQSTPQRVSMPAQNPRHVGVPVHSFTNNFATRPPTAVPVHNIRENAPPSYESVVSMSPGQTKY